MLKFLAGFLVGLFIGADIHTKCGNTNEPSTTCPKQPPYINKEDKE